MPKHKGLQQAINRASARLPEPVLDKPAASPFMTDDPRSQPTPLALTTAWAPLCSLAQRFKG